MIKTVLFDLDGTLLPMDLNAFVKDYMGRLTQFLALHGDDPKLVLKALWTATDAMVGNDGSVVNKVVFWQVFNEILGRDAQQDEVLYDEFYRTDFQKSRGSCGFAPDAATTVRQIRAMGCGVVLATNPFFPRIATYSRIRWAGMEPEDFDWITTYENSRYCKPNLDYYREILDKLNLNSRECLMVGNDVGEDMVAGDLGMHTFLMTDCLINKTGLDISQYPKGGFPELLHYIRSL